jgi:hypothetical protein
MLRAFGFSMKSESYRVIVGCFPPLVWSWRPLSRQPVEGLLSPFKGKFQ